MKDAREESFSRASRTITMHVPEWIKPGIWGAVIGAVAVSIIGFSRAGWTTAGGAQEMAEQQSEAAVTEALVPLCVALARQGPAEKRLTQPLHDTSSYHSPPMLAGIGGAKLPRRAPTNKRRDNA